MIIAFAVGLAWPPGASSD